MHRAFSPCCRLTHIVADVAHSPEGREVLFDYGWGALHEAYTLSGEKTALMQLVSDDRFISNPLVFVICTVSCRSSMLCVILAFRSYRSACIHCPFHV